METQSRFDFRFDLNETAAKSSKLKKRVLILIGIPNFNFSNENSAVLGYLKKIEKAFESSGYEVVLDYTIDKSQSGSIKSPVTNTGIKAKFKSLLKKWPWFYQSLVMRSYLKEQDALFVELKKLKRCELIVEFHSVGSTLGQDLARFWSANLSVIFDSPVDEQFFDMYNTKSAYWSKIKKSEKTTLSAAKRIMVYSPACREYIQNKYSLESEINVLPCVLLKGVETKRNVSEDEFHIGFIGSFLSWHKVGLLVEVFKAFHTEHPKSRLSLIGYGNEWEKIKEKIKNSKLTDLVSLPGFISEAELTDLKQKLTVAVMPGSNWYGSPLKLFEYAQSGIPFIAPDSKTVRSIFEEGQHCLYVAGDNEFDSLYKSLETYYRDKELREELGKKAKSYVELEFSDTKYSGQLIAYLS